jgi:hypothetical protein
MSFWLSPLAHAATIVLMSGEEVQGRIIEQTGLQVVVEVQGITETYYLGEIASINGKKVEIPQVKNEEMAPAQEVGPNAPSAKMPPVNRPSNQKIIAPAPQNQANLKPVIKTPPVEHPPVTPDPEKLETLVRHIHDMTGKMLDMNRNVIPTPDGGIIVVTPDKITKYDKDLKVIKVVDLDTPPNSNP